MTDRVIGKTKPVRASLVSAKDCSRAGSRDDARPAVSRTSYEMKRDTGDGRPDVQARHGVLVEANTILRG